MQKTIYKKYSTIQEGLQGDTEKTPNSRKVTMDLRFLELYSTYVDEIKQSLETQRGASKNAGLSRLRHDTDHKRRETMEKLGPGIFYYAQRTFSLPYDYVMKPDDFGRNRNTYMNALVFQPELIRDDFLIDLGIMNPSDKLPRLTGKTHEEKVALQNENIQKKITLIPQLKDVLSKSQSIQTGIEKRASGRVLATQDGKYIVFHEQKTKGEHKDRPNILYTPHVYKDIYALLRGVGYGTNNLDKKLEIIPTIKSELDALYTSWNILGVEEKRGTIGQILSQIQSYQSPYIARARERLLMVDYRNSVHDNGRVLGAGNDIGKYIHTHEGKRSALSHQYHLIHHLIRSEETKFHKLTTSYIEYLGQLDEKKVMNYIKNPKTQDLSSDIKKKIIDALRAIYAFQSESKRSGFIGKPFSSFVAELKNITEGVYKKDTLNQIRILFKIVLSIQRFAYTLTLHKVKNNIKNNDAKEVSYTEIDSTLKFLQNRSFLPQFELPESGKKKLESMIKNLNELKILIMEGVKEENMVKYIENLEM